MWACQAHHKPNQFSFNERKKEHSSSAVRLWVKDNITEIKILGLELRDFLFFNDLSKKTAAATRNSLGSNWSEIWM